MLTRTILSVLLLALAASLLAGCQAAAQPEAKPTPSPAGPGEGYQRPRNPYFLPRPVLVFDSPEMSRLATSDHLAPRWYDARNDLQPTVQAGYETATFESVYTLTYDRLYQHGGNVRDHYSQWTRRGTIKEGVR